MPMPDIDLTGFDKPNGGVSPTEKGDNPSNTVDAPDINGGDNSDITSKDGSTDNNQPPVNNEPNPNDNEHSSTGDLSEGDSIEVDGVNYVVDKAGNLVDDKGNIFKEAKDIADWLKTVTVEDNNADSTEININALQEKLGISVVGEDGKPVEFTNDAAGVEAYVNSVIDIKSQELQEAAVNKLFADNPMLRQFNDYLLITGSPVGFGELPDRSGIELDKENQAQLEQVIKMAAREFGNKSLNDNYIKYLAASGGLYDEAKTQLAALIEKDAQTRKDIETRAQQAREEEAANTKAYWDSVKSAIESNNIAGYKLPESFTKEVNGQKMIYTRNDFWNYLSKAVEPDENGNRVTAYQRDLNKLSNEQYLHKELLDAWMMFTGSSYKDLINMAANEEKVRQLKVKSQEQRASKTIKVIKNSGGKVNINDIVL